MLKIRKGASWKALRNLHKWEHYIIIFQIKFNWVILSKNKNNKLNFNIILIYIKCCYIFRLNIYLVSNRFWNSFLWLNGGVLKTIKYAYKFKFIYVKYRHAICNPCNIFLKEKHRKTRATVKELNFLTYHNNILWCIKKKGKWTIIY